MGCYIPSPPEIKVNVERHEREYGTGKDGELADTITHEIVHRSGVSSESIAVLRAREIINELFGDKSFVAGSCGINWELQTQ